MVLPSADDWRRAAHAGSRRTVLAGSEDIAVTLSAGIRDEIVRWCLDGRPNEACGLIAGDGPPLSGGNARRFVRMVNAAASPYRYLLDPKEQLTAMLELDDQDEEVWGIVHSHVASPAVPSVTDIGLAFYPESLYLVCSLAGAEPELRAWTIREGVPSEVELIID